MTWYLSLHGRLSWLSEETNGKLSLCVFILVIGYIWLLKKQSKEHTPLPPGPLALPIVGNLPFLDPNLHINFTKLAQKYGPIFKLHLGSKLCIVVSSPSLAKQILREQDTSFADRDAAIAAMAITYGGSDIAWGSYGPEWRKLRKVCVREVLSTGSIDACRALRLREVADMVRIVHGKVGTYVNVRDQVNKTILKVIMSMLWGGTLDDEGKKRVGSEFSQVVEQLVELMSAPNLSDFFPFLGWFDVQGIERKTRELSLWFDRIFEYVIEQRVRANEGHSGGSSLDAEGAEGGSKDFLQCLLRLRGDPETPLTMIQLKALLLDFVAGGSDTSASTIEWAMSEMMQNPKIMSKAQLELEQVVGTNNVVQESHLPELDYLDAIIKEVLRLHSVAPFLLPRRSRQACIVSGYQIPHGSQVLVNAYAIHRNPEVWEQPLEFLPDRFLGTEGRRWEYSGNDFRYLPFGSGRRVCAGITMADRIMKYVLATLVHSFNWSLPDGEQHDLSDKFGIILKKKTPLMAIPSPRLKNPVLYLNGEC